MVRWLINLMITSMIFFPEKTFYEKPESYGLEYEDVWVQSSDGVSLHGWFLKARAEKGVILFFHGNAGNISGRLYKAEGWIKKGFSVYLLDYRGYGKSDSNIEHQDDVMKDALAAFGWLQNERKYPLSKIILLGESLGTYPAIRLAAANKAAALILEAPFTSFTALGKLHYPFVPSPLISDFAFPNIDYIDKIKTPVFILHGTQDEICPYAMAGELFEHAPSPKEIFTITNGTHNDLPMKAGADYWDKPEEFLLKYLQL